MRSQRRNAVRDDLVNADRHTGEILSIPLGRPGFYNVAFEQGPVASSLYPDGWEWHPNALQTIARIDTDATAGLYSIQGTVDAIGGTAPGYMLSQHLIPASVLTTYVFRVSMRASGAGIQCSWGAQCYDSTKALLGNVVAYGPAAPGVAWTMNTQNLGSAGTAFIANTRYIRFRFNWTDVTANSWVRVDHVLLEM